LGHYAEADETYQAERDKLQTQAQDSVPSAVKTVDTEALHLNDTMRSLADLPQPGAWMIKVTEVDVYLHVGQRHATVTADIHSPPTATGRRRIAQHVATDVVRVGCLEVTLTSHTALT